MPSFLRRGLAISLTVGSLLFAYTTFRHVWEARLVVPFFDEWDFLEWYRQVLDEGLSFGALWMPHNGHHLPLPRLLYLLRDQWTDGSPAVLVMGSLLLQGAAIALLARVALREPAFAGTTMRWILMATTIVLLSWTVQVENFYWSIQVIYVLAATQAVASLYCLARSDGRPLFLWAALLLAISDTLTLGSGLGVWPALLATAISLRQHRLALGAVLVGTIAVAILYAAFPTEVTQGVFGSLARPIDVLHYMARYLGPPFADDGLRLILGGVLILAGVAVVLAALWRGVVSRFVGLHVGLVTFGLSVALLTALARLPVGVGEAGSSRYAAFSTLFWVGLVSLAAHAVVMGRWQKARWGLYGVLAGLFIFLVAASQNVAPRQFLARSDAASAAFLSIAVGAPDFPAIQKNLHPRPQVALRVADFLRDRHYGLYGSSLLQSLGATEAATLPPVEGDCTTTVTMDLLETGIRLSGHFGSKKAPRWLVVVGGDGNVQGFGVRDRLTNHFTAYSRLPLAGATLYGIERATRCRIANL